MKFREFFQSIQEARNTLPIYCIRGKEIKFVRYGGLSAVPQKGFKKDFPTIHSPPERNGIYAFT